MYNIQCSDICTPDTGFTLRSDTVNSRCICVVVTQCRAAVNECDVIESCKGGVAECPANLHKVDGTACGVVGAGSVCVGGQCNSFDQQCTKMWGAGAVKAPDKCYESNTAGDAYGNCGSPEKDKYVACAEADKFCGMLMCTLPPAKTCNSNADCPTDDAFGCRAGFDGKKTCGQAPSVAGSYSKSTKQFGDGTTCTLISVDLGPDIPNPGLVNDGVTCGGTGVAPRVCMGGTCILASSMAKGRRRLASSLGWSDWVRGVQQKISQDSRRTLGLGLGFHQDSRRTGGNIAESAVAESANTRKKAVRNEPRQLEEVKGCDGVAGSGQVADKCGVCGGSAGVGGGGAAGAAYVLVEKESIQLLVLIVLLSTRVFSISVSTHNYTEKRNVSLFHADT